MHSTIIFLQEGYLDPRVAPQVNFDRLATEGAFDIAPFKADTAARDKFECQAKWLGGLGALSLALGLGVGAVAKRHRLYGLVCVPVAIGCYFWRGKSLSKAQAEGAAISRVHEEHAGQRTEGLKAIYEGMERYLIQTRLKVEAEVLAEFNRAEVSAPSSGRAMFQQVTFTWEASQALQAAWQAKGQCFTDLKGKLWDGLGTLPSVDVPIQGLLNLREQWWTPAPSIGTEHSSYHEAGFAKGTNFFRNNLGNWEGRGPSRDQGNTG